MDQLPRYGKRELICLQLFTCNYVVSVWRGFFFLWVLGMGYVKFCKFGIAVKQLKVNLWLLFEQTIGGFQWGVPISE